VATMAGIAYLMPKNTPVALTAMIRCQASVQILFGAAGDARIVDQHIELAEMPVGWWRPRR